MPPVVGAIAIGIAKFGAAIGIGVGVVTTTTTTIAVSILTSAVSFGISKVAQLLAPRPKLPKPSTQITVRQAAAPRAVVHGTRRIAGIATDMHKTGANGEFLNVIITLTGHPVQSIDNMYFDDVLVPLDGSGDATGNFAGFVHVEKNLGGIDQARLTGLGTEDGTHWPTTFRQRGCAHVWVRLKHDPDKFPAGAPNITFDVDGFECYDPTDGTFKHTHNAALNTANWLTDMRVGARYVKRLKFPASASITHSGLTVFDATKVANGIPTDTAWGVDSASAGAWLKMDFGAGNEQEPIWARMYALASGATAQWKVQSSDNDVDWTDRQEHIWKPDVKGWNLIRLKPNGAHRYWRLLLDNTPGAGAEFGELQLFQSRLDKTQLLAAIVTCDEDVTLDAGGTEDRYTVDAHWTTDGRKANIRAELGVAMAGDMVYSGGSWRLHPGKYEAATVTLDENDIVGVVEFTGLNPKRTTYNVVRGRFTNATFKWQDTDFPEVRNETYIEEDDGEILPLNIDLPMTISGARCQRIGKIILESSRRRTFTVNCGLRAWLVRGGQPIAITFAKYNWTAKEFRVVDTKLVLREGTGGAGPTFGVDLVVKETDSALYAWTAATDEQAVPAPGVPTLPVPTPPIGVAPNNNPEARPRLRSDLVVDGRTPTLQGYLTNVTDAGLLADADKVAADGVTFGRVKGTALTVGEVDLSKAGVIQKVLDNITDSTTRKARTAAHSSYRPLSNPLTATDAGATATVNIAAFTQRAAGVDISLNAGSISTLSFDTLYFIYYDDAGFAGGSVTYNATTVKETALNGSGRFFVGSIITPSDGGSDTVGNNDGGSGAQWGQAPAASAASITQTINGTGSAISNPARAFDGKTDLSARLTATGTSQAGKISQINVSLFALPRTTWKQLRLKMLTQVPTNTLDGGGAGAAILRYSLNGGLTFTAVYSLAAGVTRGKQTDEVTLSITQNVHAIQVECEVSPTSADTSGQVDMDVWEAWVEGES